MTSRSAMIVGWVTAVAMMPWIAEARTDAFYEQRLKEGKAALLARDGVEAAEQLRIAAFGFVGEPALLSEAQVWLALAYFGSGMNADMGAVLDRFVESQRLAGGYDRSRFPDDVRETFEQLLTARVKRDVLSAIPSLAVVAGADPRRAAPPAAAPQSAAGAAKAAGAPASLDATAEYNRALALVRGQKAVQALPLLKAALERDPQQRSLRLLLLEAACLAAAWQEAGAALAMLEPIRESEPVAMFYAAVTLYETDRPAEARTMLERALPRVAKTPLVERYAAKILSPGGGS